jgi:murein DD-endopeptidase MepM/ murein hydrolase activator NlpD
MKKKAGRFKSFLQKLRFQYRVSVLNENTLEESWHIRLSRLSVLVYASTLILLTFILLTILIFATPLRYYLPGYNEGGNRPEIVSRAMHLDSLKKEVELQAGYLDVIRSIIKGEVKPDSIAQLDSAQLKEKAISFVEKSKAEKEFIENYESEEKYNLSNITGVKNKNVYVFFRPVKGVISSSFNPSENQYGINIITSKSETVLSVLSGTVVFTGFTFDVGWVISIQHENGYLSVYKNNSRLLKKIGDSVKAGEGIAVTGETSRNTPPEQFYFELWQQGKPMNPEDLIIF